VSAVEVNFDGLVGPTHNYAGLALGNLASARNAEQRSNPRAAVLQGLDKMLALTELGLAQGVLPPQERPHLPTLRRLGFSGQDPAVLHDAFHQAPGLLAAMSSASSMWTANAATVSPSTDCNDGRVHFTPANLATHLHRAIEPATTARALRAIFADSMQFAHHEPLPSTPQMGDEGAANHTRLCGAYGEPGLELFVYGAAGEDGPHPKRYPARQTLAASQAVARLHRLDPTRCHHAQQRPETVDRGVFHNDVIAVGNREVLLYHKEAFVDAAGLREWISASLHKAGITVEPVFLEISAAQLTVEDAVNCYLFNSQLVCTPDGSMLLIAARECEEHPAARAVIQRLIDDPGNPITKVRFFDLHQSMRNGGGPACLRLRVVLNESERAAVNPRVWLDRNLYQTLHDWAARHYRDRLVLADLADPALLDESRCALDELTRILGLGSLYDFQR
jgi:succinylarginine dihydrolase